MNHITFNIQHLTDHIQPITLKRVVLFILLFVYYILYASPVSAAVVYPIPQLDNCANQRECYLYCQIPQNTPACWAYGKYVIQAQVLGEQTRETPKQTARRLGISFPIAELGNCSSPRTCMNYCEEPQNRQACFKFAKAKGLMKEKAGEIPPSHVIESALEELGCDGKEACMALCSLPENHQKCLDFARRHGIERRYQARYGRPAEEVLSLAQTEFGCNDEESCWKLCNKPENKDLCMQFAKKHKLMKAEQIEAYEKYKNIDKVKLLEEAKEVLGCNLIETCMQLCSKPENHSLCSKLGRKHGIIQPKFKSEPDNDKPCASQEECKAYCQKHPDECPGYEEEVKRYQDNGEKTNSEANKTGAFGNFIGPSGCKTEEECKAFCLNYPDKCPGFPLQEESFNQSLNTLENRNEDDAVSESPLKTDQLQDYQKKP